MVANAELPQAANATFGSISQPEVEDFFKGFWMPWMIGILHQA
jgi:hypothetical protein